MNQYPAACRPPLLPSFAAVSQDFPPTAPAVRTRTGRCVSYTRGRPGDTLTWVGLGKQPLVQLIEKDDIDGAEEIISMVFNAIEAIESGCSIEPASLDEPMFQRAVKIYAASTEHTRAVVQSTSGLSGAVVGRVKLQSDAVPPASVFLKVLSSEKARDEYERYNQFVANRLPVGYFAPAMSPIHAGLRKMSALISTLAPGMRIRQSCLPPWATFAGSACRTVILRACRSTQTFCGRSRKRQFLSSRL